jgi:AAA+ superfamily predicted ATPase
MDLVSPIFAQRLEQAVQNLIAEWANFDQLAEIGVPPARTCLFFGPPGTGKTRLAYYVAASLQLPIVTARLDGLISSFLGTTARNLGNLFDFANRYRCLLLLDVNTLLQNVDARSSRGLTIAITNHEKLLDKAVWRRFESRIAIPPPGPAERAAMLERYLPPLESSTHMISFLAWLTEGMTGSELQTMTNGLKRNTAIHGGAKSLIENVQAVALTNANLVPSPRMALLFGGFQKLAIEVLKDTQAGITQAGLAAVLQKDQTTISRWIRSEAAEEGLVYAK